MPCRGDLRSPQTADKAAEGGRHLPQEEGSGLGATRQRKLYETLSAIQGESSISLC